MQIWVNFNIFHCSYYMYPYQYSCCNCVQMNMAHFSMATDKCETNLDVMHFVEEIWKTKMCCLQFYYFPYIFFNYFSRSYLVTLSFHQVMFNAWNNWFESHTWIYFSNPLMSREVKIMQFCDYVGNGVLMTHYI